MRTVRFAIVVAALAIGLTPAAASGPVGFYGIIERVVFEPDAKAPDRIQVWGVFASVDIHDRGAPVPEPERGYLYFEAPPGGTARTEWRDLAAVAGTGQAVAFGMWSNRRTMSPALRVRRAGEKPVEPAPYLTNAGVVKLTSGGSHADLIKKLRLLAVPAAAGTVFRLELGPAVAANLPNMKKGIAFVVRGLACADPAKVQMSAVADSLATGTGQSTTLALAALAQPGAFAVPYPGAGSWVVSLTAVCGAETAGAVVPLGQAGFVREKSKTLERAPSKADVDAAFGAAGAR